MLHHHVIRNETETTGCNSASKVITADLEVNIDRELLLQLMEMLDLMTVGVVARHSDAEAASISAPTSAHRKQLRATTTRSRARRRFDAQRRYNR